MSDLEHLHAESERMTAAAISLGKLAYDLAEQASKMREALGELLAREIDTTLEELTP